MHEKVIIGLHDLFQYNKILRVTEACFTQLLELTIRSYPHKAYEVDIWHVLEAHIEIDKMTTVHLENLEFNVHQFIERTDEHIRKYLYPYEYQYECEIFLDDWTAVFHYVEPT